MLKTLIKRLNNPPLSRKEQGLFAERLALLLGASMSLPESIAIMRHAFGKNRAALFAKLENSLSSGASFESVLSDSTLGFSRTIILAARIGERSGTLAQSLTAAASQIERQRAVQASLISALTYPLVIFLASVGIIAFLVFFFSYKRATWFKNAIHQSILRIPIVSRIIRAHMLSEIFDTVSTLASAGCPFIESVAESASFTSFIPYRKALFKAIKEMQVGSDFSSTMANYPRLFPGLAIDSIAIGERTGNMEAILPQMSRYYARELQSALTGFSKLIEPALMIVVGIIVGAAALSIVLPIYDISQHLSG
jgi:type IV pilus assembly protein PilC